MARRGCLGLRITRPIVFFSFDFHVYNMWKIENEMLSNDRFKTRSRETD